MFSFLGTPTERDWPGISSMPDYKTIFPKFKLTGFNDVNLPEDVSNVLKVRNYTYTNIIFSFIK